MIRKVQIIMKILLDLKRVIIKILLIFMICYHQKIEIKKIMKFKRVHRNSKILLKVLLKFFKIKKLLAKKLIWWFKTLKISNNINFMVFIISKITKKQNNQILIKKITNNKFKLLANYKWTKRKKCKIKKVLDGFLKKKIW